VPTPMPVVPTPTPVVPTPTPVVVTPPPATKVTIRLESEPSGAGVYLADREIGRTPYEHSLDAGSGEVSFLLKRRGYRDHAVAVVPDRDRVIQSALRPSRRGEGGPSKTRPVGGGTGGGGTTGAGGLFKASPFD
jgi:hypothetical protein